MFYIWGNMCLIVTFVCSMHISHTRVERDGKVCTCRSGPVIVLSDRRGFFFFRRI